MELGFMFDQQMNGLTFTNDCIFFFLQNFIVKVDNAAFSAVRDDSTDDFTAKLQSFAVNNSIILQVHQDFNERDFFISVKWKICNQY